MYIQKFKIVMAVCCMYKSIVDALNMGYNPVYVTQVTGASYNNGEIVICKKCGSSMKYNHQKNYFRCTNYKCSTTIHGFSPLPFNHYKNEIKNLLLIFANFCNNVPISCVLKIMQVSPQFASNMYDIFRKQMASKNLMEMITNPLNGFVQIDESLFAKRKNHVGRIVNNQWVFGGCSSEKGGTVYFLSVPKRDTVTLAPVIGSIIQPGSIVTSDEWKAYNFLSTNGYIHLTVNHSTNFVDPMTSAHTQRIESMWAAAKLWRRTHGYKSKDALQEYLHEFCYRYNHGKSFDYIWKNLYR